MNTAEQLENMISTDMKDEYIKIMKDAVLGSGSNGITGFNRNNAYVSVNLSSEVMYNLEQDGIIENRLGLLTKQAFNATCKMLS